MEHVYVVPDLWGKLFVGFTDIDFAILATIMGGGNSRRTPLVEDPLAFIKETGFDKGEELYKRFKGACASDMEGMFLVQLDSEDQFLTADVGIVGLMLFAKKRLAKDINVWTLPILDTLDNLDLLVERKYGEIEAKEQ